MIWDTRSAQAAKARREQLEAKRKHIGGRRCPNCKAPADCDVIEVSDFDAVHYVFGPLECSASCYEQDPEAYLEAVKNEHARDR